MPNKSVLFLILGITLLASASSVPWLLAKERSRFDLLSAAATLQSAATSASGQSLVKAKSASADIHKLEPTTEKALASLRGDPAANFFVLETESTFKEANDSQGDDAEQKQKMLLSLLRTNQEFNRYIDALATNNARQLKLQLLLTGTLTAFGIALCASAAVTMVRSTRNQLQPQSDESSDDLQKLAILADNVQRAAKSMPLNPPLDCNDRWAEIDEAIHSLSHAVQTQDDFRRAALAAVAHDIRSPLSSIRLFIEAIEEGVFGNVSKPAAERASDCIVILKQLDGLLDDLLEAEKGRFAGTINVTEFDIVSLINSAIKASAAAAEARKIDITLDLPQMHSVLVRADETKILQVLLNLITNAIKFSPRTSSVMVRLLCIDNEVCKIAVEDSGPGVSQAVVSRLFAKFEQEAKSLSYKGYGLGLNIAKSIVEQHGGTIGFNNLPNGSCFWFTLPMRGNEG